MFWTLQCTRYTVNCTRYTVNCTRYTVNCTRYTVNCTPYTVLNKYLQVFSVRDRSQGARRLHSRVTQPLPHLQVGESIGKYLHTKRGSPVDRKPSTAEAPAIGKIQPFSKVAVTLEPEHEFGCPSRLRISKKQTFFYWTHHLQPLGCGGNVKIFSQHITLVHEWIY